MRIFCSAPHSRLRQARSRSAHGLAGMRVLARPPTVDLDKNVLAQLTDRPGHARSCPVTHSRPRRARSRSALGPVPACELLPGNTQSTQTSVLTLGLRARPRHACLRSATRSRPRQARSRSAHGLGPGMRVLARPSTVDSGMHVFTGLTGSAPAACLCSATRSCPRQARSRSRSAHGLGPGILARPPTVDSGTHVFTRLTGSASACVFALGHPQSSRTITSSLGSRTGPGMRVLARPPTVNPDKHVLARLTDRPRHTRSYTATHCRPRQLRSHSAHGPGSRARPRHARSRSPTRSRSVKLVLPRLMERSRHTRSCPATHSRPRQARFSLGSRAWPRHVRSRSATRSQSSQTSSFSPGSRSRPSSADRTQRDHVSWGMGDGEPRAAITLATDRHRPARRRLVLQVPSSGLALWGQESRGPTRARKWGAAAPVPLHRGPLGDPDLYAFRRLFAFYLRGGWRTPGSYRSSHRPPPPRPRTRALAWRSIC